MVTDAGGTGQGSAGREAVGTHEEALPDRSPGLGARLPWKRILAICGYLYAVILLLLGGHGAVFALVLFCGVLLITNDFGLRSRLPFPGAARRRIGLLEAWLLLAVGFFAWSSWYVSDATRMAANASPSGATVVLAAPTIAPPSDPNPEAVAAADEHVANARDYWTTGDTGLALTELDQALAAVPVYPDAIRLQQEIRRSMFTVTAARPAAQQGPSATVPPASVANSQPGGQSSASGYIPGLSGADVVSLARSVGFTCSGMKREAVDVVVWDCELWQNGVDQNLEIIGHAPNQLTRIDVDMGQVTNEAIPRATFAALAAIAYEGAEPLRSKAWAEQNTGHDADMTIAGVDFSLTAGPTGYRLFMIEPHS